MGLDRYGLVAHIADFEGCVLVTIDGEVAIKVGDSTIGRSLYLDGRTDKGTVGIRDRTRYRVTTGGNSSAGRICRAGRNAALQPHHACTQAGQKH